MTALIDERLSDGSVCTVLELPGAGRSVIVSRFVEERCVWGQVFSYEPDEEAPGALVLLCVESMRAHPENYVRPWLLDEEAVTTAAPPGLLS